MRKLALIVLLLIAVLAMSASACASDDGAPAEGTVMIEVLDLEATVGQQLGGALLSDTDFGGTGVAGFTAIVDADPFSTVEVLGEVTQTPLTDSHLMSGVEVQRWCRLEANPSVDAVGRRTERPMATGERTTAHGCRP